MPPTSILQDIVVVLGVALAASYALNKLRVPSMVGLLVAGVLIGPGGFKLVREDHSIEIMAEVGVVLLLFTVGLKFSLRELGRMKLLVFGIGGLQVSLTAGVVCLVAWMLGIAFPQSLFMGFLVSLSSTAILLKVLEDRGEIDSLYGRILVATAIFQDLAIVPMMLLLPVMGAKGSSPAQAAATLLQSFGMVALVLVAARFILPWALERVARARSHEIFNLSIILIALGAAYATESAGLSMALGAFLAGVILSESPYSHQVMAEITPIRDALTSLFFVSIGMLVDPGVWIDAPLKSAGVVVGVLLLKSLVMGALVLRLGFGPRIAVLCGLGIAQIGEFSFVMALVGKGLGLLDTEHYRLFLTAAVVTMALTPFIIAAAPRLMSGKKRSPGVDKLLRADQGADETEKPPSATESARKEAAPEQNCATLKDHVIIVGYGVSGRNVAHVLRGMGIRYVIVELNPYTVRELRERNETAIYGDVAREGVLKAAGVTGARALVIAVTETSSMRQAIAIARSLSPKLVIIARSRYTSSIPALQALGANEIVPEEFETSLELASRVMATYGAGPWAIERERAAIRRHGYRAFKPGGGRELESLADLLATEEVLPVTLAADSPVIGLTVRGLQLRERHGVSIVAIRREGEVLTNPAPDLALAAGDILILLGKGEAISGAKAVLEG